MNQLLPSFFYLRVSGKLLIILLLFCLLPLSSLRAQIATWSKLVPVQQSAGRYETSAIASDGAGNVYMTGTFFGSVTFGSTTLRASPYPEPIYYVDSFVAKYNTITDRFEWAKQTGASRDWTSEVYEQPKGIAVRGKTIYLNGTGFGTFDGTSKLNTTRGDNHFYVTKLTDLGADAALVWTQRFGGEELTDRTQLTALAVSGENIYVAGTFSDDVARFGKFSIKNTSFPSLTDGFVVKLTDAGTSGNVVWVQRFGGNAEEEIHALAVANNRIYIAGHFWSRRPSFGTWGTIGHINSGGFGGTREQYLARLTDSVSTGHFTWAQSCPDTDITTLAASDSALFITGNYYGEALFTGMRARGNTTPVLTTSHTALYVAKLRDARIQAELVWARQASGNAGVMPKRLLLHGSDLYLTGVFNSTTCQFGLNALQVVTDARSPSSPYDDIFVAKVVDLGRAGDFTWAQQAGGPQQDEVQGITISGNRVYLAAKVIAPAVFGSYALTSAVRFNDSPVRVLAGLDDNTTVLSAVRSQDLLGLHLYPNPATTRVMVRLPSVVGATSATVTLLDAVGRRVQAHTVALLSKGTQLELSLLGLPAGVYLLRVQAGAASAVRRLSIQ